MQDVPAGGFLLFIITASISFALWEWFWFGLTKLSSNITLHILQVDKDKAFLHLLYSQLEGRTDKEAAPFEMPCRE